MTRSVKGVIAYTDSVSSLDLGELSSNKIDISEMDRASFYNGFVLVQ